jgi:hypothetical protein
MSAVSEFARRDLEGQERGAYAQASTAQKRVKACRLAGALDGMRCRQKAPLPFSLPCVSLLFFPPMAGAGGKPCGFSGLRSLGFLGLSSVRLALYKSADVYPVAAGIVTALVLLHFSRLDYQPGPEQDVECPPARALGYAAVGGKTLDGLEYAGPVVVAPVRHGYQERPRRPFGASGGFHDSVYDIEGHSTTLPS